MESFEKALEFLDEQELVKLTQKLISIPSYHGLPQPEKEVAHYINDYFKKQGFATRLTDVIDGRPNVITSYGDGEDDTKTLMLNGHMDTVPAQNMTIEPFKGFIEDGKIFGRGAVDMKGPIAAMMMALVILNRANIKLKGKVHFAGVIDEEKGAEGTRDIVRNGPKTKYAIVGEPTDLLIANGHRGLESIQITIKGKYAHGGTPDKGINAIAKMNRVITEIQSELLPRIQKRSHPITGSAFFNLGVIEGGTQPSTVPGECILKIDRRWLPSETRESIIEELREIISKLQKEDKEINGEVKIISPEESLGIGYPPLACSESSELVKTLKKACEKNNEKTDTTYFPAWTDGSILSRYDIETVVFGPGHLSSAHSDVEFCPIDDIVKACKVYIYTILNLCK